MVESLSRNVTLACYLCQLCLVLLLCKLRAKAKCVGQRVQNHQTSHRYHLVFACQAPPTTPPVKNYRPPATKGKTTTTAYRPPRILYFFKLPPPAVVLPVVGSWWGSILTTTVDLPVVSRSLFQTAFIHTVWLLQQTNWLTLTSRRKAIPRQLWWDKIW